MADELEKIFYGAVIFVFGCLTFCFYDYPRLCCCALRCGLGAAGTGIHYTNHEWISDQ